MNKTKIDWADYSWNIVTGCKNDCEYCYAKKIANRFKDKNNLTYVNGVKPEHLSNIPYPYGFLPTFHPNRLNDPQKVKEPQSIFVCSMADLFGEWVPDEWIKDVFKACEKAPQHRYLFLTKNPDRYIDLYEKKILPYKENIWLGTTITRPSDEFVFFKDTPYKSFISIEPILEPFGQLAKGEMPQWIIVGAETGNRKGKVIPKKEWIMSIKEQCRAAGVPLFMKESLRKLMGEDFVQEFPWEKRE
ncbi:hypothetical protein DW1_1144 [Proteiniborus sp. DW1]|uniref:DUF5131 family protein n=1 Tax=Proteiniborus sp. DW1 TaxID=1889883 RepID=UPI00092E1F14|nr:DUF5131 family protein [Proteiniborus sp. DW1]SCG82717.1 hypothetical protein DW1_1144 [Proteiniborus sp. DW1]